jgi:hypothetical protein
MHAHANAHKLTHTHKHRQTSRQTDRQIEKHVPSQPYVVSKCVGAFCQSHVFMFLKFPASPLQVSMRGDTRVIAQTSKLPPGMAKLCTGRVSELGRTRLPTVSVLSGRDLDTHDPRHAKCATPTTRAGFTNLVTRRDHHQPCLPTLHEGPQGLPSAGPLAAPAQSLAPCSRKCPTRG